MKDGFEFQHPWVLVFLALLPLYAFFRGRAGADGALRFSSTELVRAIGGRVRSMAGRLFIFLRLLTVALTIVAMAGPRWMNEETETQASGVDIMIVFDLSWSMMALDMAPPGRLTTRFDIAQSVLKEFVARRPSDRIGLIAFSGVPYLDRLYIGVINELGTAIGDATGLAVKRLAAQKLSRDKLVVLLTDGDNNKWETLEPIASASLAAGERVRVYTIGIGKNETCVLHDFDRETGKLRLGPDGQPMGIITMLQPANYVVLEKMSKMTGGKSYTATNRQELDTVYADIDRLEKTEVKLKRHRTYTPLFYIPLLGALAVLLLEVLLANTRFRRIP
jgi:Ca-activated chloride channel family protein